MNDTPTPETDEAAGDLTGINLSAAFETKCRQLEIEKNRLANFARDLERQLAEATAWRKIETAPKDGTPILIATGEQPWPILIAQWEYSGWRVHGNEIYAEGWGLEPKPTHWQPLPNPPTV